MLFSWDYLIQGFWTALQPINLWWGLVGCLVGTLVGVLPGIGPSSAIAILIPLTTFLEPTPAIIMMAAIYYGAMYGGSTTAIVVNIPGEASSVPTAIDGYELAKQGRAGPALAISAISSFVAGTLGLVGLTFFAPILSNFALAFGPPEFSRGSPSIFFTRPIACAFMILSFLSIAWGIWLQVRRGGLETIEEDQD